MKVRIALKGGLGHFADLRGGGALGRFLIFIPTVHVL